MADQSITKDRAARLAVVALRELRGEVVDRWPRFADGEVMRSAEKAIMACAQAGVEVLTADEIQALENREPGDWLDITVEDFERQLEREALKIARSHRRAAWLARAAEHAGYSLVFAANGFCAFTGALVALYLWHRLGLPVGWVFGVQQ